MPAAVVEQPLSQGSEIQPLEHSQYEELAHRKARAGRLCGRHQSDHQIGSHRTDCGFKMQCGHITHFILEQVLGSKYRTSSKNPA